MTANLDVDMSLDMDVDVDMPPTPRRVVHQKNVSGQTKKLEHKTNKSQMVENRPWLEVSIQCICLDSSFVFDLELPLQTEGLDIWSCVLRSLECLPVRCRRGVSISFYFQLLFFFLLFFFIFYLTSTRSRGEIHLYGMENVVTNGQQGRVIDVNMSARTWKWTAMGFLDWDADWYWAGRKHKL